MLTMSEVEYVQPDGWATVICPPWSKVSIGNGMVATITPAGIACDCGKGVFCVYNTQERMGR